MDTLVPVAAPIPFATANLATGVRNAKMSAAIATTIAKPMTAPLLRRLFMGTLCPKRRRERTGYGAFSELDALFAQTLHERAARYSYFVRQTQQPEQANGPPRQVELVPCHAVTRRIGERVVIIVPPFAE
jgi:hypothetical protein